MLYYGAAKLPLKQFFLVSGVVVIVLAAGLLANGLSAICTRRRCSTDLGSRPWDTETTIPMTSTMGKFLHTVLGYDSAPAMAQIVAYWTYLIVVLSAYLLLPVSRPPKPSAIEPNRCRRRVSSVAAET